LEVLIDVIIFTGTGMYKIILRNVYKMNFF